jgi:hypothetical protein
LTVNRDTAASAVPATRCLDVVVVVGRAGMTGTGLATVGTGSCAVSTGLGLDWVVLTRAAGPSEAGPQPDSSRMTASTVGSDLVAVFMVSPPFRRRSPTAEAPV